MSKHHLAILALAALVLAALACNTPSPAPALPPPPTSEPTPLTVKPTKPASPTAKPTQPSPALGSVSGKLCYPGSEIPPMTIYAVDQAAGQSFKTRSQGPSDTSYRLSDVTPGTYLLYAWLDDGETGGSYSKAVPCGLSASCTDHTLIPVTVKPGQNVTGIDVCDWYGPPPPAPPK